MHPALEGIRFVVFDLDGTLIDSAPDLSDAVDATLADCGAPPAGIDKVRTWVGNGSCKLIERALTDATHCASPTAAEVDSAHAVFLAHYAAAPCERTRMYDGARECLQTLQNRDLVQMLVSNKPIAFLPLILERLAIDAFFSLTLGGDSLAEKKPHPAPLLHAAQHAGVVPCAGMMVGDSRSDVAAGKAAGFRTLAVTYGYSHGEAIADSRPDYLVDTLAVIR